MSSVVIAGNTSGSVTLSAPDVAGTTTITLPSTSGTMATTSALGGGATTTSSAVDITLTSSSTRVQNVNMTAAQKAVILPDATTLSTGGPIFNICNTGVFPINVKVNGGASILTIQPLSAVYLSLTNNSTAAGTWFSEDITTDITFGDWTTITSNWLPPNSYSFIYGSLNSLSIDKVSSTSAIIAWNQGTNGRDVYAAVVTISGSSITVGSATLIYSGSSTASLTNRVKMLSSTAGFVFIARTSTSTVAIPITISGTTITVGTASAGFGAAPQDSNRHWEFGDFTVVSSTVGCISYGTSTVAPWNSVLNTITHNGTSAPTLGTASANIVTNDNTDKPTLSTLSSTSIFVTYTATSTVYPVARIATLSGTSAPTLGTANTSATQAIGYQYYQSNPIFQVSSTEVIVMGTYGSVNYTISGTTVTYVGYQAYISIASPANYTTSKYCFGNPSIMGDNILVVGDEYNSNTQLYKKNGSYLYIKGTIPSYYSTVGGTSAGVNASAGIGLDSTKGIIVTSTGAYGNIYASVVTYIGA